MIPTRTPLHTTASAPGDVASIKNSTARIRYIFEPEVRDSAALRRGRAGRAGETERRRDGEIELGEPTFWRAPSSSPPKNPKTRGTRAIVIEPCLEATRTSGGMTEALRKPLSIVCKRVPKSQAHATCTRHYARNARALACVTLVALVF